MVELISKRRQAWIYKINRKDWIPSSAPESVLNEQFISGVLYSSPSVKLAHWIIRIPRKTSRAPMTKTIPI